MNQLKPIDGAPRYMQILSILGTRLETGVYPVDSSLPSEGELCEEFAASRYTIREALRRLVAQGMLSRRRGSGSVVIASRPQASYVHTMSSLTDLFQYALTTHYELLSIEMVSRPIRRAELLGGEAGQNWNLVKGVRRTRAGGEVVSFIHSYIPDRLTKFVKDLPGCVGPFYAHLSCAAGEEIIEADQEIRGDRMTREMARYLGGASGDVAICALRRYKGRKGPIITSFNWHAPDKFVFAMKILKNS